MGRFVEKRLLENRAEERLTIEVFFLLLRLLTTQNAYRNPNMDVNRIAAGWCSGGHGVVFPKQETALRQSLDNHFVCTANIDCRLGGVAALQPADKAKIQFGGNAYDYPRARQFLVRRPLQGFDLLQKRLFDPI